MISHQVHQGCVEAHGRTYLDPEHPVKLRTRLEEHAVVHQYDAEFPRAKADTGVLRLEASES